MNDYIALTNQRGAAITEFLALLLVIVPMYFLYPYLAKYISINQVNLQATRYVIWERTIWSTYKDQWKNNTNTKSDEKMGSELITRFYMNQTRGLDDSEHKLNNFWMQNNKELILVKNNQVKLNFTNEVDFSPVKNDYSDRVAYRGFKSLGYLSHLNIHKCNKLDDINFASGLGLGANTYNKVSVSVSIDVSVFNKLAGNIDEVVIVNKGGILANDWSSTDRQMFKQRVLNLVQDKMLDCVEKTANTLSILPIYKEGKLSKKADNWLPYIH